MNQQLSEDGMLNYFGSINQNYLNCLLNDYRDCSGLTVILVTGSVMGITDYIEKVKKQLNQIL